MRDINRIYRITYLIAKHWSKVPDWRFTQLIENFKVYCGRDDLFYMEDEEFEKLFNKFFEEMLKENK